MRLLGLRTLAVAAAALLSLTSLAGAASLYVSTSGRDTNSGTISSPFRTISRAARSATPGTVVYVRRGTYRELVRIYRSGTSSAPIVFKPYPSELVVIDGASTPDDTSLVEIGGDYVRFDGFHVRNSKKTGISSWATHHVTIHGNRITGSKRGAIWVGASSPGQSHSNVIAGNVATGNCLVNLDKRASGEWPVAVALAVSDNSIIRGNRVYKNHGEGIGALSSTGTQIVGNVSYDNYSILIYLDNAPSTRATGNIAYHTGDQTFFRSGRPARGIQIANEWTDVQLPSRYINVTGNVLAGVGRVTYGTYGANTGLRDSVTSPNTIHSSYQDL